MKLKRALAPALFGGIAVSAAALWLAFRNIPLDTLADILVRIELQWVWPALFLVLLCFFLRAWRWWLIVTTTHPAPLGSVFHILMVGFMLNGVVPGRAGELARPALLRARHGIPYATGLATVVAERFLDLTLLLILAAVVLPGIPMDDAAGVTVYGIHLDVSLLRNVVFGMLRLGALISLAFLCLVPERPRRVLRDIIRRVPDAVPFLGESGRTRLREAVCERMIQLLEAVASGLRLMASLRRVTACVGLTAAIWILQALSYYVLALGCPGVALSPLQFFVVMVIVCFAVALPSVPGFWGVWEAGGVFAMGLFGVGAAEAAGYTLANHALQLLPAIIVGWGSALHVGFHMTRVDKNGARAEGEPGGSR